MMDFEWFVSAGAGLYVGWTFASFMNSAIRDFASAFMVGYKRGRDRTSMPPLPKD